ncbi:uncharacterized protein EMH_0083340 [Eimeria mitis]|uniref:Transmembrane protein n=1 Tax=Eimeria mitis TaxID=44415 RepID=U6K688_9EIME|nr:uncharacterized protein EMH_0083340 [Eimeria mitis]CDJ33520.1 hypothetical protein, conserved [Eimeria mitis]
MLTCWLFLLITFIHAASSSQGSLPAASAPGACSAAGDKSSSCSAAVGNDDNSRTLRDLEAYVAFLEGKLEEKLQKQEQQQWEQQRNLYVLLAVSICLAVVFIVAISACKVYVHSLQNQLQCSFQREEQRGQQDCSAAGLHPPRGGGAPQKSPLRRDQSKLSSVEMEWPHQKDRWSSSWCSEETHPTTAHQLDFDDDLGDDEDACLYPSSEDVADRARAVEEVRAAAGLSPELQQQQQQLEARCSRLFERLHEITDVSRAFCSSSSDSEKEVAADVAAAGEADEVQEQPAAVNAPSGDTAIVDEAGEATPQPRRQKKKRQRGAADPARLEEQRGLLQQLQQLFREIDAAFITNKPAHVSVMIRCCNALLRADGLAVLKACADCPPLHAEAQSIIEIVVPCIWAT